MIDENAYWDEPEKLLDLDNITFAANPARRRGYVLLIPVKGSTRKLAFGYFRGRDHAERESPEWIRCLRNPADVTRDRLRHDLGLRKPEQPTS